MSEVSAEELMEDIRDGLAASAWSSAVVAMRKGNVSLFSHEGDIAIYDVLMGRRLPFRVELDLDGGDWSCTCVSTADSCAHVAAAAIAFKRSQKSGKPSKKARKDSPAQQHLRYEVLQGTATWYLRLLLVEADGGTHPVPSLKGLVVPKSLGEKEVLGFPGWVTENGGLVLKRVEAARLVHLLSALSMCRDVAVNGVSVRVNATPVRRVLVVQDHPQGLLVREGVAGGYKQILTGPMPLAVTGDPATLCAMAPSPLRTDESKYYQKGRLYAPDRISYFMGYELPRLKERIPVEMRTAAAKPTAMPVYALLRLTAALGGLDAVGSVAYGRPVRAVVVEGRLHLLKSGAGMPIRMPKRERELGQSIEECLSMPVGRKLRLRGEEAARFVEEVVPRFPGQVSGLKAAGRFRRAGVLSAQWEGGDTPSIRFSLPNPDGEALEASAQEVWSAWREGRAFANLLDGGIARIPENWMAQYGSLLEQFLDAREGKDSPYRKIVMAQLMQAADVPPNLTQLRDALLSTLKPEEKAPPAGLKAELRSYQAVGLSWLCHLEKQGLGGILADDMGLGKTLQALALILSDVGKTLVVAPTSVVHNWKEEAKRFAPELKVVVYQGSKRKKIDLESADLVITSYSLLRLDIESLEQIAWHRAILDEAQAIKNPESQVSRAAKRLNAQHRFALTGTPVENHLRELWSLLDFVNPKLLGGRRNFEKRYANVGIDDGVEIKGLRARVQPFVLRRLKQDVATDLPPKTEVVLRCDLSADERKVYEAVRLAGLAKVQKRLTGETGKRKPLEMLEVLLRLRQAACHPGLVPGSGELSAGSSSKIRLLLSQLDVVVQEGHRALVFSQWTSLLDLVEVQLKAVNMPWLRLDGSTRDRQGVVQTFQAGDGPNVFLISLKAGGTGLNLTAADYVYLLDPWWNPAVEAQAIDRTYRIGQENPVVATRLVAADTVEERILSLQLHKRKIAEAALGGEAGWLGALSDDELHNLLAS